MRYIRPFALLSAVFMVSMAVSGDPTANAQGAVPSGSGLLGPAEGTLPERAAGHVGAAIANESLAIMDGKTDGFDVAEKHYAAVVDDQRLAGSPVQALASQRQAQLGGLREPVVFAPTSRPTTRSASPVKISASRPAVELAPRPTTKSAPRPASRSAPSGK